MTPLASGWTRLGWFVCAVVMTVALVPAGVAAQAELLPAATLRSVPGLSDQVWPADFNRDGFPDLAGGRNSVQIALGNGDGTFRPPVSTGTVGGVRGVGDLNGDRFIDIVAVFGTDRLLVLPGNGDGTFQPARPVFPGEGFELRSVMVVDLDNDGRRDLAFSEYTDLNTWALFVLAGRGDFTFEEPILVPTGGPAQGTTGDFNGDGLLDIALAHMFSRELTIHLNSGQLQFTSTSVALPYLPPI